MIAAPSISVVIAAHSAVVHAVPLAGAHEVIAVGDAMSKIVGLGQGIATRHVRSNAPAGQRANIGISLASGEWVVVLSGTERLGRDWLTSLAAMLSQGNVCAHCIQPAARGLPLVAVWRTAFAYGSLDGRFDHAPHAMDHWITEIFPHHRHRVLPREGVATHSPTWMESGSEVGVTRVVPDDAPDMPGSAYDPQRFWEAGGRGWVKWEAFQPDETEISALVERTQPRHVLELGCGGGRNGRYFVKAERYAGLDISMPLLHRARDRQENNSIGLVCGDATQLPFADGAFDLVFAVSTLQHILLDRIAGCITDILRVTRRYIGLIEFTDELVPGGTWFKQPHMFRHDYAGLLAPYAELLLRRPTSLQIQPAAKELFLFEKR
jgi:SAM-dependent methyltransferase